MAINKESLDLVKQEVYNIINALSNDLNSLRDGSLNTLRNEINKLKTEEFGSFI